MIYSSQAILLADTFQKVRDLTKWYLSLLKQVDPYKKWEVNGVEINSVAWLAAHITWAENFLILSGTGGAPVKADWLNHYQLGCDGSLHTPQPEMKMILDTLKEVHIQATEHLLGLSDEKLNEPNPHNFAFGGINTNRILIQHAIRHEAMHTGHLSWLCKINKIESV
ncbi:MAG: DinB family protein [Chitinophagales bacterium]|nr:DinB family protein [Chitinophagales bacterium]